MWITTCYFVFVLDNRGHPGAAWLRFGLRFPLPRALCHAHDQHTGAREMADIYSVLDARSLPKLLQMLGPRDAIALVTVSKRSRDAVRSQPAWHRAWKAWSGSRWGSRIDAIADDLSEEELAEAGLGRVATSDKRKETTPKQSFWERYYARRSSTWIPIASPMTMFQES